ncbi:DUF2804 domain-containing protein [Ureibacillus sinduriensis]|uniref:DUF2804 domain-containing protein n=1 Tax=Ureibacillus sinduriensis BLB-1 = JCM 15800 TaxID=1384057 RepID=A0A0A3HY04_9BACL|nr:DUF2804 domain-containing protein [Ureibacillus sinduriensis]KGR76120.1 hypothetical protein CD33_08050 [Ureibacillus sinduriensis BLB-1 = JCM 15800]
MSQHAERELTELTRLCDKKGNLNPAAIGFARKPIIDCNLSGHYLRKKKWNNWYIYGEEILFSIKILHFDYAAICSVNFLEYETQRFFEKTLIIPLGIGSKLKMPNRVLEPIQFKDDEVQINITYFQNQTFLKVTSDDFDSEPLLAELTIHHPQEDESLNVVVPWNRQTFQFTAKHHTLPVSGFVKLGYRHYHFNEEDCFGVLDFGRGVWPREARWNWAMASQRIRNQRIGINFGGQWTDGTGMTENAVFVNGHMFKIHEDVVFNYDPANFMKPWYITSKFSDTIMLTFHPFFEHNSLMDAKFVKSSKQQLMGYYNGQIKLEDGSTLLIQQMLGYVDEQQAKW